MLPLVEKWLDLPENDPAPIIFDFKMKNGLLYGEVHFTR
jgi:hypothetical protein